MIPFADSNFIVSCTAQPSWNAKTILPSSNKHFLIKLINLFGNITSEKLICAELSNKFFLKISPENVLLFILISGKFVMCVLSHCEHSVNVSVLKSPFHTRTATYAISHDKHSHDHTHRVPDIPCLCEITLVFFCVLNC